MSEDLVLRPYRRGDETEILTLMEQGFNGWPKFDLGCTSVEHWRWKYLNSPLGESSISVAVSGKEIIGFSQQYRVRLKIFDELIEANFAGDLVVHSEFRRRGLSNRLIELNASIRRLQGVDFVYFVTRNPHLVESYSKRYLQLPFPISNMVRIRDIDDQLDAIEMRRPSLMKIAYLSARVINRASNLLGG